MASFKNEVIWIIGASSGIGKALARELSEQGATLILSSRRKEALDQLNSELENAHEVLCVDVSINQQVEASFKSLKEKHKILDRVIFLAAIYKPGMIGETDAQFAQNLIEVNLLGAIYTTYCVLPFLREQGYGQIVLCGSVAGYTGLPKAQPYSASKAGVINFAESLYAEQQGKIDIKLINPGFVETPMTEKNDFNMPMKISAQDAAKAIASGLKSTKFEIHFPKRFTYFVKILACLPYFANLFIARKMREKL